ncbi:MAG: hypothetical protein ACRED0_10230, partial [Gammaproteobacteria bacterium]
VLARHYGFTDEELDFIINYDIKYRMGGRGGGRWRVKLQRPSRAGRAVQDHRIPSQPGAPLRSNQGGVFLQFRFPR